MSDFQNEMNHAVQSFVTQLTELARRAAIDTLESAFQSRDGHSTDGRATSLATAPGVARGERPLPPRGAKRSPADLEELSKRFAAFVKSNPGLRIEQINKELGTTTRDLALPIRKLIAERIVGTKGQKRATTYFAGKKAK